MAEETRSQAQLVKFHVSQSRILFARANRSLRDATEAMNCGIEEIQSAVLAERERCAVIADKHKECGATMCGPFDCDAGDTIAAKIRSGE